MVVKGRLLVPAMQFGLWFFAFMLLESFVNSSVATLIGVQTVNAAYSIGIFCTGSGLLAFGLAHAKRTSWRKGAVPFAALICSAATVGVAFSQNATPLALSACIALLACGFIGGRAHHAFALEFGERPSCGRMLGAVAGTVVCVQFLVQNYIQGSPTTIVCIVASLVILAVSDMSNANGAHDANSHLASCRDKDGKARANAFPQSSVDGQADEQPQDPANAQAWPQDPADKRHHGIYLVSAAAILTIIFTLNDSIVVALDASGSLELFSGVRLFYALGLVVAGFLYDLGPRFSFTFSTVAVQLLAVLVPYFLWAPEWYNLNMALFYFYGGFYVMFITAEFVSFSSQMTNDALWAGLGRMTRCYAAAATVIPVSLLYAAFGIVALVAMGVALNMALLAVCVADAVLLVRYRLPEPQTSAVEAPTNAIIEFDELSIERFAQSIGLTDRELEVLVLMVTTEDENQKMADSLGVSRRTLQRHIAQVYEKAGVQSRIGLYRAVAAHVAGKKSSDHRE